MSTESVSPADVQNQEVTSDRIDQSQTESLSQIIQNMANHVGVLLSNTFQQLEELEVTESSFKTILQKELEKAKFEGEELQREIDERLNGIKQFYLSISEI